MDAVNINIPASPISPVRPEFKLLDGQKTAEKQEGISFDSFLQAYMDVYRGADTDMQAAESLQLDIATGKSDDIIGLSLAMEKASSSLNFTVQVTSRLLEAYKEIMRLQM